MSEGRYWELGSVLGNFISASQSYNENHRFTPTKSYPGGQSYRTAGQPKTRIPRAGCEPDFHRKVLLWLVNCLAFWGLIWKDSFLWIKYCSSCLDKSSLSSLQAHQYQQLKYIGLGERGEATRESWPFPIGGGGQVMLSYTFVKSRGLEVVDLRKKPKVTGSWEELQNWVPLGSETWVSV